VIRLLGVSFSEGINVVLMGPRLVPIRASCYKKRETGL
jgi:hypothetical protein